MSCKTTLSDVKRFSLVTGLQRNWSVLVQLDTLYGGGVASVKMVSQGYMLACKIFVMNFAVWIIFYT